MTTLQPGAKASQTPRNLFSYKQFYPQYDHCPLCGKRTEPQAGPHEIYYICNNCQITIVTPHDGSNALFVDWGLENG